MALGAFLYPTGYHIAAWRHPRAQKDAAVNFAHHVALAQTAERGAFDFLFLADSVAVRGTDWEILSRGAHRYVSQLDPLTLMSGLAAVTERIGLVASVTTTYNDPFHVARKLASLDHISGGRAGWNLVTSQNGDEALNFGLTEHPSHAARYARAREFVDVVRGLWDSWEDDAFVRDAAAGRFFDPSKLHVLGHHGEHFSVRGPLNVPRTPQGHPVIVQAGASPAGRALAGATAEVVFTAQQDLDAARAFYTDVKEAARQAGRAPEDIRVLVGVFPFVGRTDREAQAKLDELQALVDPTVGLSLLGTQLGEVDLSQHPLDGPLPPLAATNASRSRQNLLVELARRENLTIRQLYLRVAGARGHWQVVGSAEGVADQLERWFTQRAADGFIIMPPCLPDDLTTFVELVIPELRRRKLFRDHYEGHTFREHLGLRRPSHPARQSLPSECAAQ